MVNFDILLLIIFLCHNFVVGEVQQAFSSEFPDKDFKKMYGRPKPKHEDSLIFYCRIGQRSDTATGIVEKIGYRK